MKRLLSRQLLNIVFLALIVAGALTVYFLSRGSLSRSSMEAAASFTASPAASPTVYRSAAPRAQGVPKAVFTTHLAASELYRATVSADDPNLWTLCYGEQPGIESTLQFTVDGGAVSSLELSFPVPPEYDAESESAIERYLAGARDEILETRAEAVRAILCDLLPASDLNGVLSQARVRLWAEKSLQIDSRNDDYSQSDGGCSFLAYQSLQDGNEVLVCLFFLED